MSEWDARVQSPRTVTTMAGFEPLGPAPVGPGLVGGELLPASWRTVPLERLQRWQLILSIAASVVVIAAGVTTILQRRR